MNSAAAGTTAAAPRPTWLRIWDKVLRAFHAYAAWLASISWLRFIVTALIFLAAMSLIEDLPPFSYTVRETVEQMRPPKPPKVPELPPMPTFPEMPKPPAGVPGGTGEVEIKIDREGIRVIPRAGSAAASAASAAQGAASEASKGIVITPSPEAQAAMKEALEEARANAEAALREWRHEVAAALQEAAEARREYEQAVQDMRASSGVRVRKVRLGEGLMNFALFWVLMSVVIKITYKGRLQAEVKAAQATETAESESLKRQVVEARMAAMQAQVEPHFLFNTLASIDHLIETAPERASQMQKNLIALLRASMPTMREASTGGVRELGRELAVIKPYLEILKVRMEERLQFQINVPEGLHSAEFPPMMIQGLVENAIKHGLEPKAEGGSLLVKAEIVHGKLAVTVADTGVGFGQAATRGTGVGLANIRERLQLLHGSRASLSVAENKPSGTVVTVTVPYKSMEGSGAAAAAA
jgi:signal transduction histidine kinase